MPPGRHSWDSKRHFGRQEDTACLRATLGALEDALEPLGIYLKSGMSTNYLETIKMMVNVGLGWSVLPRSMLNKELKTLRIEGIKLERKLGVVWHTGHTLSNAAKAMSDMLKHNINI